MSHDRRKTVLFGAALLVILGVWPVLFNKLTAADAPDPRTTTVLMDPAFAHAGATSIADVAEEAVDSVVSIKAGRSAGSGVIISHTGIVITNHHVVAGSRRVTVTDARGRDFSATVTGRDADSDLAVLEIDGKPRGLKPMPVGDSDKLRLGEIVLAIGNPLGIGHSVSMGIVSAKNRGAAEYVQTDAAINKGNSGGALVNMRGELVGINTAIVSTTGGSDGIGFAIPSNNVAPIVEALIKDGARAWLGVSIQTVDRNMADDLGLRTQRGVYVARLVRGGPAARAGLRRGDVIVKAHGKEVSTVKELQRVITTAGVGTTIEVEVVRGSGVEVFNIQLVERHTVSSVEPDVDAGGDQNLNTLGGLVIDPLNRRTRDKYSVPKTVKSGVVVTGVQRGSAAAYAGLRAGDVIMSINRRNVKSVRAFEQIFERNPRQFTLRVWRRGQGVFMLSISR